jgi:hypothetical protein
MESADGRIRDDTPTKASVVAGIRDVREILRVLELDVKAGNLDALDEDANEVEGRADQLANEARDWATVQREGGR